MSFSFEKLPAGGYAVTVDTDQIGFVRKVPQNPAYGRGSGPVSSDVLVWGTFKNDHSRFGRDYPTRKAAGEALARGYGVSARVEVSVTEEWRRLATQPYQNYEVSSLGNIRRGGRNLVGVVDRYGYRTVQLSYAGIARRYKVHRLICETFNGPCPDGLECGHLSGDQLDNRACNLAWVTRQQNVAHNAAHGKGGGISNLVPGYKGLPLVGSRNGRFKLSDDDLAAMLVRRSSGATLNEIADQFHVHKRTVQRVLGGTQRVSRSDAP